MHLKGAIMDYQNRKEVLNMEEFINSLPRESVIGIIFVTMLSISLLFRVITMFVKVCLSGNFSVKYIILGVIAIILIAGLEIVGVSMNIGKPIFFCN